MISSRVKSAVCFRPSTAPASETVQVFVKTGASGRSLGDSPIRQNGVTLVIDGENMGEVDWAAEAPSPRQLYKAVAHERVEDVLAGGRACFIACGQAASGKSSTLFFRSTMEGSRDGLLPHIAMHLFAELPASCRVSASFVELYNDALYDLLARGAIVYKEAGSK